MEKLLIRPDETAAVLGVSRSTVYALISAGTIPTVKVGGSIRVPTEALRAWLAASTHPTTVAEHR